MICIYTTVSSERMLKRSIQNASMWCSIGTREPHTLFLASHWRTKGACDLFKKVFSSTTCSKWVFITISCQGLVLSLANDCRALWGSSLMDGTYRVLDTSHFPSDTSSRRSQRKLFVGSKIRLKTAKKPLRLPQHPFPNGRALSLPKKKVTSPLDCT